MSGETFGAIRWDAWWSLAAGSPSVNAMGALCDAEYQWRAPAHAVKLSANRIVFDVSQARFDDEIQFAHDVGGPNFYWAYLLYAPGSTMRNGINLHMASSIASRQKFCLMVATDQLGFTNNYTTYVDEIVASFVQKPFYFILPSGKPLLYVYYSASNITGYWSGNIANFKVALDYLKSKFTAYFGTAPYVVCMAGTDNVTRQGMGAEASSNYISGFSQLIDGTYAQLDTSARNYWASIASAVTGSGGHVVPICMMGWGSFPRHRRPEGANGWIAPEHGMRYGYVFPTTAQITAHVQAAMAYVNANPSFCPEKTMLAYAWNENSEGGWLNKTFGDPDGLKLAAVRAAIGP